MTENSVRASANGKVASVAPLSQRRGRGATSAPRSPKSQTAIIPGRSCEPHVLASRNVWVNDTREAARDDGCADPGIHRGEPEGAGPSPGEADRAEACRVDVGK